MTEILRIIFYCFMEKYATFEGRAGRKEFAVFSMFYFLLDCTIVLLVLSLENSTAPLPTIPVISIYFLEFLSLVLIIPGIAVAVRRLHDLGYSGWWHVLWYISILFSPPIVILLLDGIFCFSQGTPGPNKYGEPPN